MLSLKASGVLGVDSWLVVVALVSLPKMGVVCGSWDELATGVFLYALRIAFSDAPLLGSPLRTHDRELISLG